MLRRFLCAAVDLPKEEDEVDCVCLVPFCLARSEDLQPSSQYREVLKVGLNLFYRFDAKYMHTGGGHPRPRSIETEGFVGRRFLLRNLVGETSRIVTECESWDTGDNAWYFRRNLQEHKWQSVLLVVVSEQSQRALQDFTEYLSEQHVGWPVRIYVMPVPVKEWNDNVKFALRSRWRFMAYEIFKRLLRNMGFIFFYKHRPEDRWEPG